MVGRTTDTLLGELDKERNRLISKLRFLSERSYAVIKRVFGAGRASVTTVRRSYVKMMVTAFAFNLYQQCTLRECQGYLTERKLSKNDRKKREISEEDGYHEGYRARSSYKHSLEYSK